MCSGQGPSAFLAHDSHSVNREEVNTPSSDTETVGGVSDVSICASSSTVVLEPEVMVDDIVVGRAVREAIRGLDISAIFSRRVSVMRSPPKFLSGAFRSAMRVALHEIVTGAERHDKRLSAQGGNCSCCCRDCCCSGLSGAATSPNSSFWNGSALSPAGSGTSC